MCIGNVFYTNPNVLARTIFFTAAAAALAISIDYSAMTTSAIDDDFFCIHCDFFFMSCLRFHFHNWHLLLQIGFGWSQPEADMYLPLLFRKTYRRKMLSGMAACERVSVYVTSVWWYLQSILILGLLNCAKTSVSLQNYSTSITVKKNY